MEKPGYFAVIPADVRYCKEIEMGAKLLYGEITALSNMHGFCWAANEYFAEVYEVDISTIKRWIASLKDHKFIVLQTEKEGLKWSRKIWLACRIKINSTKAQKQAFEGSKMSQLTPAPHHIVSNNITKNNTPTVPQGKVCVAFGDFVKLSQEEYDGFVSKYGKEFVDCLIESVNDHIKSKGIKPYKDYAATMRNWIKRNEQRNVKAAPIAALQANADLAKKISITFKSRRDVYLGPDYLELGVDNESISFSSKGFRERVISKLRKMNLPVEGL